MDDAVNAPRGKPPAIEADRFGERVAGRHVGATVEVTSPQRLRIENATRPPVARTRDNAGTYRESKAGRPMTLLHVILRGIKHRPGRSVVVLALAAVATAAAVLTPAYTAAAHQSLLTDALNDVAPGDDGARFVVDGHRAKDDAEYFHDVHDAIGEQVTQQPSLAPLADPVAYSETKVAVLGGSHYAASEVIYREGLCGHLKLLQGKCDTDSAEVLISKRSAELQGVSVGEELGIASRGDPSSSIAEVTVAGIYEPTDASNGYWGRSSPFDHSTGGEDLSIDALFMTLPQHTATVERPVEIGVDYSITNGQVNLDNDGDMKAALSDLDTNGEVDSHDLKVETQFDATLKAAKAEQDAVTASVPLVTVPLLLLAWFVLYLVVARLSEERAPQIALAKLRGHRFVGVMGMGTGEAAILIAAGVPLGAGLGWAIAEGMARLSLTNGTTVAVSSSFAVYSVIALLGAWAATLAASRPVLSRPVLALLRRVPARGSWRTGASEGALVVLAVFAVWQVLSNPEAATIGLLATPLLAVVVGIMTARALELSARYRLPGASRAGRLARMIAQAQVARRPESRRVVILVTVAAAVVTFGVCAWDVSRHNRELTAADQLGADRVFTLSGGSPETMMDAVEKLDPNGDELMAVMRRVDRFDNMDFTTVAVQTDRLPAVAIWRDTSPEQLLELAADLHPKRPEPLRVNGTIKVKATVNGFEAGKDPSLVARVVGQRGEPVDLRLGKLSNGSHTYRADSRHCRDGCRLLGIGVSSSPGDFAELSASMRVKTVSDDDGDINASFDDCHAWQAAPDLADAKALKLDCDNGLNLEVSKQKADDYIAAYASTPSALPVVLAGQKPSTQVSGDEFEAMGPQKDLQRYRQTQPVSVVPRGGTKAMMVDLDYTNQTAQHFTALNDQEELSFEIWASEVADTDVAEQLAGQGLVVAKTESYADTTDQLSHAAPALALRLYLVASGLALLLVVGAVMLTSTVSSTVRGYDVAALRATGVSIQTLRSASVREYLYCIVLPAVVGIAAGLAGLALVLPSVPLVSSTPGPMAPTYVLGPLVPSAGLAIMATAFALVGWASVRASQRRGSLERLREGDS